MSLRVSGSVRARWATGCARPVSIEVNEQGSAPANARNSCDCAARTPSYGWNEIYSNERRASAGVGIGTVTRYQWVAARKAEGFPINKACEFAGVSRQAFYDWRARTAAGPTPVELAEVEWSR